MAKLFTGATKKLWLIFNHNAMATIPIHYLHDITAIYV